MRLIVLVGLLLFPAVVEAQTMLQIPAWTNVQTLMRYPSSGTFDVSHASYVAGVFGLNPANPPISHGVAIFYWTSDVGGQHIVGVQGMNLSSLIVSLNQLHLPNLGPNLYITYQPFLGPNPIAANLFGTNNPNPFLEWPGDTILIDERDQSLAPNTNVTWYPDDYWAGQMRLYLSAPTGVTATLWGADLADVFWPLDSVTSGSITTIAPMGTWMVVVSNQTSGSVTYTIAATPLVAP